jgi:alkanesulfonate monooxygenase SsuD/methylene tetrahydromethanopterin reductase-like flavin-dependent oxidoreductase (luciferase family)
MKFGVHLPLIEWPGRPAEGRLVLDVAERAERAGYTTLCANDHLVYARPWLDGPTALAAAATVTSTVRLMTTVALPVVRGPFALAKALAAIDVLSGGRVIAGLGPGSSRADYGLISVPFEERWSRFEEATQAIRSLWRPGAAPFVGDVYSTAGVALEPLPAQAGGPPIWIGSWGSDAGLRRVARLADGWLASAYNTTPSEYRAARSRLDELTDGIRGVGSRLPTALATGWMAITPTRAAGRALIERVMVPVVGRPAPELEDRLLIGPESLIVERLSEYAAAGLEQVFVWPVIDEVAQLERFAERIMPRLAS